MVERILEIHVFKYFRSSGLYAELFPKVWRTLTCQKLWEFCELWFFFRNHKKDFCKLHKRGNCYSWWRIMIRIFLYKTQPVPPIICVVSNVQSATLYLNHRDRKAGTCSIWGTCKRRICMSFCQFFKCGIK